MYIKIITEQKSLKIKYLIKEIIKLLLMADQFLHLAKMKELNQMKLE